MTQTEKLAALETAYTTQKRGEDDIIVLNEQNPAYEAIKGIQFKLNDSTDAFNLDYEIMSKACNALSEYCDSIRVLKEVDVYELSQNTASVYTIDQLSYVHSLNQQEISDTLKEYGVSDIATAAAVWYEYQVAKAMEMLRAWVLED